MLALECLRSPSKAKRENCLQRAKAPQEPRERSRTRRSSEQDCYPDDRSPSFRYGRAYGTERLTFAATGPTRCKLRRGALLQRLRVGRGVRHQLSRPYFCRSDFLTNSASNTRPAVSGLSLKQTIVFVVLGFRII